MKERDFQASLIKEIKKRFEGAMVLKNDPNYIQGVPDLIVLIKDKWIALECKRSADASHRPNQNYYVETMNGMGFAKYVYPENKEEILNEIKTYLGE